MLVRTYSQAVLLPGYRFGEYKRPQALALQVAEHRAAGSQPVSVYTPIFSSRIPVVIYFLASQGPQVTAALLPGHLGFSCLSKSAWILNARCPAIGSVIIIMNLRT